MTADCWCVETDSALSVLRAGLYSGVCSGGQDSLLRITDQEQCLFSQIKPDNGVGFHVNMPVFQSSLCTFYTLYDIINIFIKYFRGRGGSVSV